MTMSKCDQCIIKQFNSLRALEKDDLIRISGCKTSKYIKKGEVLFKEGDNINGVYCVKSGVCKMSKLSANGKDQIVKLVVRGDLIGQRSLVTDEVSNLTAIAVNEMEVCFIPKNEVLHDLAKNVSFSLDMLQDMGRELRVADNIIVDMAQKSVKRRLADVLTYLHETFDKDEDGYVSVVLSREDYASLVGTATESAIRILSQFKKEGLIATTGKHVKIVDFDGLRRVE